MASFNRIGLRDAVRLAAKALPPKSAPVEHRCVRIGQAGVVAAGPTETSFVRLEGSEAVDVSVNALDLLSRIEASNEDLVSLNQKEATLEIKTKRSRWTLPLSPTTSRDVVRTDGLQLASFDAVAFRRALDAVLPAGGDDVSGAPEYFGVQLLPSGRVLTTDGRRLHAFSGGMKLSAGATITTNFARTLVGLKGDTWRFHDDSHRIIIETDAATFVHRQLGLKSAPVDRLVSFMIEKLDGGRLATVSSSELIAGLRGASVAAKHGQVIAKVVDGMLVLKGRDIDDTSQIEVSGDVHPFALCAAYLADAVEAFGVDAVDIRTAENEQVNVTVCPAGSDPAIECAMIGQVHQ